MGMNAIQGHSFAAHHFTRKAFDKITRSAVIVSPFHPSGRSRTVANSRSTEFISGVLFGLGFPMRAETRRGEQTKSIEVRVVVAHPTGWREVGEWVGGVGRVGGGGVG